MAELRGSVAPDAAQLDAIKAHLMRLRQEFSELTRQRGPTFEAGIPALKDERSGNDLEIQRLVQRNQTILDEIAQMRYKESLWKTLNDILSREDAGWPARPSTPSHSGTERVQGLSVDQPHDVQSASPERVHSSSPPPSATRVNQPNAQESTPATRQSRKRRDTQDEEWAPPPRKKAKAAESAQNTETIDFDEVFKDGIADRMIVKDPESSDDWYILQCDKHDRVFRSEPLIGGSRHLNSSKHGYQSGKHAEVVREFGIRVLNCDAEKAEQNNAAFRAPNHTVPKVETSECNASDKAQPPSPVSPSQRQRRPDNDHDPDSTVSASQTITDPAESGLYLAYWRTSSKKTSGWYAVVRVPVGLFETVEASGTITHTDLISWAKGGYEDGGPNITKRKPIMWFGDGLTIPLEGDFEVSVGGCLDRLSAKQLLPFNNRGPDGQPVRGYDSALRFSKRLGAKRSEYAQHRGKFSRADVNKVDELFASTLTVLQRLTDDIPRPQTPVSREESVPSSTGRATPCDMDEEAEGAEEAPQIIEDRPSRTVATYDVPLGCASTPADREIAEDSPQVPVSAIHVQASSSQTAKASSELPENQRDANSSDRLPNTLAELEHIARAAGMLSSETAVVPTTQHMPIPAIFQTASPPHDGSQGNAAGSMTDVSMLPPNETEVTALPPTTRQTSQGLHVDETAASPKEISEGGVCVSGASLSQTRLAVTPLDRGPSNSTNTQERAPKRASQEAGPPRIGSVRFMLDDSKSPREPYHPLSNTQESNGQLSEPQLGPYRDPSEAQGNKQRRIATSRTGWCINCRKRRRKCDEKEPQCRYFHT